MTMMGDSVKNFIIFAAGAAIGAGIGGIIAGIPAMITGICEY